MAMLPVLLFSLDPSLPAGHHGFFIYPLPPQLPSPHPSAVCAFRCTSAEKSAETGSSGSVVVVSSPTSFLFLCPSPLPFNLPSWVAPCSPPIRLGCFAPGTTILSAIKSTVDPSTEVVFSENPTPDFVKGGGFSYGIVVVGETPYAEDKGYSPDLALPEPGPSTIQNVCGAVDKCVVVLVTGRPVVVEPYLPAIDALVAVWLPGTEGKGVTDVLFGDYGFTGKLTMTWVKRAEQLPLNAGARNYDPLFKLNFGLTTEPAKAG